MVGDLQSPICYKTTIKIFTNTVKWIFFSNKSVHTKNNLKLTHHGRLWSVYWTNLHLKMCDTFYALYSLNHQITKVLNRIYMVFNVDCMQLIQNRIILADTPLFNIHIY